MKKLYCFICGKYKSYLLGKTLVLSIIGSKCKNKNEKNI